MDTLTDTDTDTDTDILEHLDFEVACGGRFHGSGKYGHNPAESASFIAYPPCCDFAMPSCASWVADFDSCYSVECGSCGTASAPGLWRLEPMGKLP